jgi:hypothetical protein
LISNTIGELLSHLIGGMNTSIRWLEGIPHSNVTSIAFSLIDVVWLYALLGGVIALLQTRSFRRISITLSLLLTYTCYLALSKTII